jgi:hypothetical protein
MRSTSFSSLRLFLATLFLLVAACTLSPLVLAQVTSTQMVGPSMPRPRPATLAPPKASAVETASDALSGVKGTLKGFFKNTGRTVPEKTSTRGAVATKPSEPVVVGSPSSNKPTQVIDANDFMKLNPDRDLPASYQAPATAQTPSQPAYTTAPVTQTLSPKAYNETTVAPAFKAVTQQPQVSSPQSNVQRPSLLTPLPPMTPEISETQMSTENPPKITATRIDAKDNPLGIAVARSRVEKVHKLMQAKNHVEAKAELFVLRQWLIEATEAHVALYKTLNDLPSGRVQAEFEKQLALEFAKLRDTILYDTARYYVWTNQSSKAVKELVEVVQSQSRSDLGLQAYELLQTIGFTEQLQLTN